MATTVTAPSKLRANELQSLLGQIVEADRVLTRPIDRIAYASDASFYRLIPQAVIRAKSVEEIQALFRFSQQHSIPLTFRSGGTSLSGQAISDGLLIDTARHWRNFEVREGGRSLWVQPGLIGGRANQALAPFKSKIGPDPASIATCTLGGILANNSSGMCCGVEQNAYHTLQSIKFVLPSGTVIDTRDPNADEIFRAREPELVRGIMELKAKIEANVPLRDRIRRKYRMKNTTGYGLNAFLDFETPIDIFQHLLIGSEGTLAFTAEAILNTVPDLPVKYTGLLLFSDLYAASASILPLKQAGAKALEIMDRASLRSVETQPGVPATLRTLPEGAAGLLAEFQSGEESERSELERLAAEVSGGLTMLVPGVWTHDAGQQALLWKIRSGMFPSVGSVRKSGTTVIIEDVAFPVERLADAAIELTGLFKKHAYDNGIIFGHAKDGNLHFVMTQGFTTQAMVDQYEYFMDDVVELVVNRYDGALKAEHGTGRNMAPFVETEWGSDAYEIMRKLKELCDPHNLLNPGVLINPDPKAHISDLKQLPSVEEEVDKCIECGFCEPKCPSRDLTLTPRQRIVVRREMVRLQQNCSSDRELYAALDKEFPYMALDTCAADGLCATGCPVSIDTGTLVKRFRKMRHSESAHRWSERIAKHFSLAERGARIGLRLGHAAQAVFGKRAMLAITRFLHEHMTDALPLWTGDTPHVAGAVPTTRREGAAAIYFPSCVSRTMGRLPLEEKDRSVMEVLVAVAERAGLPVFIPKDVAGNCCGTPFSSKGFDRAHKIVANRAIENLWQWTEEGKLPVVVDTSPCTYGFVHTRPYLTEENEQRFDKLRILDAVEFVADELLPKLKIQKKTGSAALHPVCSITKMGLTPKLQKIASACSESVTVPISAGCCGFAGDRGFLVPELTQIATRVEAAEVSTRHYEGYYSSSRTCEIGMTRSTGEVYRSFLYLLEKASR
ncbi:FAD linked oxidase-like protein [Candidatus Koribacter versatilis Ellin345]|uniref:D-lactate dehydrogenase (cytochrome) n=1 Tax=Koribacter versatilis (strain Ellin345) TaxID=204669 RepID=Q1IN26_KORVE|nr:FAD-binding and (Fe-S)-binding domain-containing protein [Candidatus Koribacter versatilis]ABF41724.1 FAD linked oxidase-like protein [Candidatus Koribacter versatilis Ellin345]